MYLESKKKEGVRSMTRTDDGDTIYTTNVEGMMFKERVVSAGATVDKPSCVSRRWATRRGGLGVRLSTTVFRGRCSTANQICWQRERQERNYERAIIRSKYEDFHLQPPTINNNDNISCLYMNE